MANKELQESLEFFDNFVNTAISQNIPGVSALDVVKHYNNIKNRLAQILVEEE